MKKNLLFLCLLFVAMLLMPWQLKAQYLIEENFDNLTSGVPEGWVVEGTAFYESYYSSSEYRWQSTYGNYYCGKKGWDGTEGLFFNTYSASKGQTAILKSPLIDLTQSTKDLILSFNLYDADEDDIKVYISTDGG